MKVLVLGSGQWYVDQYIKPKCQSCATLDEYNYCVEEATRNGTLVRLDCDPMMKPDVVATVHSEDWASKVKYQYGNDFDVIIDEISNIKVPDACYYHSEVVKLLKPDGVFYGWYDHKKVKWFNTQLGLVLSTLVSKPNDATSADVSFKTLNPEDQLEFIKKHAHIIDIDTCVAIDNPSAVVWLLSQPDYEFINTDYKAEQENYHSLCDYMESKGLWESVQSNDLNKA
jgi:hypothetical protein